MVLLEKIQEFGLVDIWRKRNRDSKEYTWQTNNFRKQSRLDFFLISENLESLVQNVNIEAGYRTDHSLVFLKMTQNWRSKEEAFGNLKLPCFEMRNIFK